MEEPISEMLAEIKESQSVKLLLEYREASRSGFYKAGDETSRTTFTQMDFIGLERGQLVKVLMGQRKSHE